MRSFNVTTVPGAVTVENESQQVADRDLKRDLVMLLNPDSEEGYLYYAFGQDAASDGTSMSLAAGEWVKFDQPGAVPTDAIHVTAADAEHKFVLMLGRRGTVE
jgi:hypothetical protein